DDANKHDDIDCSSELNLSFGDTLYLHPNDTSGSPIVTIKIDVRISLPLCTCEAAKHFEKHNQLIKFMSFIIGLDESYLAIRSNILTREPLPLVKAAFAVVSGEESHRNATSVLARLMSLLNDNDVSTAKVNMTVSAKFLINVVDNPNLGLTMGHPNGTRALMTKIDDLKINNDITLYDVLVVLEYIVSLLSVHKLARHNKLFVGFNESICYIQDLRANKNVGIGTGYRWMRSRNGGFPLEIVAKIR
nr:ribonuclease H-like domain-containing protein [Tanacetum cinerariifolium]